MKRTFSATAAKEFTEAYMEMLNYLITEKGVLITPIQYLFIGEVRPEFLTADGKHKYCFETDFDSDEKTNPLLILRVSDSRHHTIRQATWNIVSKYSDHFHFVTPEEAQEARKKRSRRANNHKMRSDLIHTELSEKAIAILLQRSHKVYGYKSLKRKDVVSAWRQDGIYYLNFSNGKHFCVITHQHGLSDINLW